EASPGRWLPFYFYIFRGHEANTVNADAKNLLGMPDSDFRKQVDSLPSSVQEGTCISIEPRLDGFEFNPPSATIGFHEEWHRLAFRARASVGVLCHRACNGVVAIMADGIIIGDIPISIYITDEVTSAEVRKTLCSIYKAVFCSYSRKDLN